MKTYAISLKKTEKRYNYIKNHLEETGLDFQIIDAVDGEKLSREELKTFCDVEKINEKNWMKKGHIGNVLSHLKCYKAILASEHEAGLVVEDDVILPQNINDILKAIESRINNKEVILLYYISRTTCKLSSVAETKFKSGRLLYPLNFKPCTTTAYVISREAAEGMVNNILPITTNIDSWQHFYELNAFSSFRVFYPIVVKNKFFRTTLQDDKSLRSYISSVIEKYKIPFIYNYLRKRRESARKRKQKFEIVDEVSPIYEKFNEIT